MKLKDTWPYIEDIEYFDEGDKIITLDTRSCHATVSKEMFRFDTATDDYEKRFKILSDRIYRRKEVFDNKHLIDLEDIYPLCCKLNEIRIKRKALQLRFKTDGCEWWLKYVRIYKLPDNDKYIVCNQDAVPIKWRELTDENFYDPWEEDNNE